MPSTEELSSRSSNIGDAASSTTGIATSAIASGKEQLDSLMSTVDSVKQLSSSFDKSLFTDFSVSQIIKLVDIEKLIRKIIERILAELDICELMNSLPLDKVEEVLKFLIDLKNKAVELLVKVLTVITSIISITSILNVLLNVFTTLVNLIPTIALAIPSAVPPGIGVPVGVAVSFNTILDKINGFLNDIRYILSLINSTLTFIAEKLSLIINILNAINLDLFQCAEKLVTARAEQENREPTQEDFNNLVGNLSPIPDIDLGIQPDSYKGFTFDIKIKKTVEGVPQNFAVTLDVRRIQVLEGLPSFASSTDVLIEELKLTIDRNNLSGF